MTAAGSVQSLWPLARLRPRRFLLNTTPGQSAASSRALIRRHRRTGGHRLFCAIRSFRTSSLSSRAVRKRLCCAGGCGPVVTAWVLFPIGLLRGLVPCFFSPPLSPFLIYLVSLLCPIPLFPFVCSTLRLPLVTPLCIRRHSQQNCAGAGFAQGPGRAAEQGCGAGGAGRVRAVSDGAAVGRRGGTSSGRAPRLPPGGSAQVVFGRRDPAACASVRGAPPCSCWL